MPKESIAPVPVPRQKSSVLERYPSGGKLEFCFWYTSIIDLITFFQGNPGFPADDQEVLERQEEDEAHPSFARYRPTIRATGRVAALIRRFESMPRLPSDSDSDSAEPRADSPTILVWLSRIHCYCFALHIIAFICDSQRRSKSNHELGRDSSPDCDAPRLRSRVSRAPRSRSRSSSSSSSDRDQVLCSSVCLYSWLSMV